MKRAAIMIAPLAALLSAPVGQAGPPIVIHYYTQWSTWVRQFCASNMGDTATFRDITHIQYSFMAPNENCEIFSPDIESDQGGNQWQLPCELECPGFAVWPNNDTHNPGRGSIGCLKKLAKERGFKFGVSLGGWTLSTHFSNCVSTPANRSKLIASIKKDVDYFGWDFVDFDWEYPAGGGNDLPKWSAQEDWANFKTFVLALKQEVPGISLAAAVGVNPNLLQGTGNYQNPTPADFLCKELDHVSLMTYDLMGGWAPPTGWPAPLYHDPAAKYDMADKLNIKWALEWWKEQCGSNFNKVILGLPQYGKGWKDVPAGPDGNGLYQSSTGASGTAWPYLGDGSFSGSEGTMEIWDIEINYIGDSRCKHYFHEVAKQDFIYCPGQMLDPERRDIWFAYDGPEVMYEKTKLAKEMGAGGVMYWEPGYTKIKPEGVNWGEMKSLKAENTKKRLAEGAKTSYWPVYEAAIFDAWDGKPIDPHKSAGIRVGDPSNTPAPPSSTVPTAAPSSSTTTTTANNAPAPSPTVDCDEVSNAVMNGVSKSCITSFCSSTCKYFMAGACKDSAEAHDCLHTKFYELPPAGKNGITCAF